MRIYLLLYFSQKANPKGVSVTCVATIWLQSGEFVSPITTKMSVFQPCILHIIFLIYIFSLAIDNLPMKMVWLILRAGIYNIMHVCLSISDQLFCKIKLFHVWVNLNAIPTCVIITNLFWTPIFQDIITSPASGRIVVFSNFLKTDFIGTVTESWRYMLSSLLPCELMWHCIYPTWSFPGFSIIFRMKYFMSLQWSFRSNTWYCQW